MLTVYYNGKTYVCTTAIRGTDYIHLLDKGGYMLEQFDNVVDFGAFILEGGEWTIPTEAYDFYVRVSGSNCKAGMGNPICWSSESFEYFQKFIGAQISELADKHYIHTQTVASDTWYIVHNLGKLPSITVVDSAGTIVIGDYTYIDENTVQLKFSGAFSGKASLN